MDANYFTADCCRLSLSRTHLPAGVTRKSASGAANFATPRFDLKVDTAGEIRPVKAGMASTTVNAKRASACDLARIWVCLERDQFNQKEIERLCR
jgi:hypothetical protein